VPPPFAIVLSSLATPEYSSSSYRLSPAVADCCVQPRLRGAVVDGVGHRRDLAR
jgi:hypothetical protein